ncbi:MAG: hypothetical protein ACK53T_12430 [Planctomycetota bacterium]
MKKIKISRPLSPIARRVRAGVAPFAGVYAVDSRAQLATLRARLDDIASDERATPNEKAAQARTALAAARDWQRRAEAQAERDVADVLAAAQRLDAAVRAVEHNQSPIDQLRIQRASDALKGLPAHERAANFETAFARRDLTALLSHSLLDPLGDSGKKAIGVLVDRDSFERLVADKGQALSQLVAVRQVGAGLTELTEREDPHEVAELPGRELVAIGNQGVRAVAGNEELETALAATAPSWLRSMMLPGRGVTASQQQTPSDEQPAAGGAA